MNLYLENNTFFIDNTEGLKKYQISQLVYFGFQRIGLSLQKTIEDKHSEIIKIINYLKEEVIGFEVSDEIKLIVQNFYEKREKLELTLRTVTNLKNGIIDKQLFSEFESFLITLPRKLKPHQIKAAFHFYSLKNGANFSVPGSGKTSVILSVYEKLKAEGKCNTLFVIGPPACFQPWKNEFIETLGRHPDSIILSGGKKQHRKSEYFKSHYDSCELYLSTFHTALNDCADVIKFLSQKGINVFLVIDEAHYMKQVGGTWAESLLKIGQHAIYRGVLTGTPIPKSYKDVFNLFDFLWNDSSPLTQDDKIQINLWEKKKKNEEIRALLNEKIGALFYRVRKKDLGLMPPKFHEPIIVTMNQNEKLIYDYIRAKILDLSQDDYFKNETVLNKLWRGRMMRMRQAVSYPKLLSTIIEEYDDEFAGDKSLRTLIREYDKLEIPGKLQALTEIVEKLRKEKKKILIWSNFIGTLELIKSHLTSLGEKCELIYGKTPIRKEDSIEISIEKTREDIRDEFVDMNSGLNILIANPAACAESISLHKTCFHAIYYDLSYNCAQYIQSMDRIHRVGGSENNEANYYFLQYANSLDQDIKSNLDSKAQRMYEVIELDYEIYNMDLYDESGDDDIEAYKRLFKNE